MASGSQLMTTYYAKRIIGDSAANTASTALLQSGVQNSMWIFGHARNNYGIKYLYDNSTNGTADKIEFHGGHATNATAWVQLDTGDTTILGTLTITNSGTSGTLTATEYSGNAATATSTRRLARIEDNTAGTDTSVFSTDGLNVRWYSQTGKISGQPTRYGFLFTVSTGANSNELHQLWAEQANGSLYHRGTNGSSHASPPEFKTILDSSNYTSYTVTKTGSGASGSWGIDVTGSSASCTGNAATATALGSNAGGTEQPIYFTGGKPAATTYALKATVNNGTASYLAYYSDARAISSWSYAKFHDGCLSLFPTTSNYREGLRIHATGSWSDITLCGNDNTGDTGITANSWFIGNNNGNFYIARNGSPGTTAYLSCVSNGWNFLNSVTFGARVTSTAPSTITDVDRIIITPYYHTSGPWKITSRDDASNAYLSLYYSTTETARMQHNGALLLCNNISFTNSGTAFRGINYGTMGDNDEWRIGGAATAANSGYMELATADDGNEPIYVRQYTGVFTTVKRTLTLLDANGNSGFPGNITCVGAPQTVTAANMAFNGGVQLREVGAVGNAQSAIEYGPRLSFHWSNKVAKSITLNSDGIFYFRDQNGTTRSTIDANVQGNAATSSSCSGNAATSSSCSGNAATASALNNGGTAGPQIKLPSEQTTFSMLTSGNGAAYVNYGRLGLADAYANIDLTNYRFHCNGNAKFTGAIITSFKDGYAMCAYGSAQTTVANLLGELRYSNGATGSANLAAYTGTAGGSMAAGWYNFFYSPHRVGGLNGGANSDNHNYGSCILAGMTVNTQLWYVHYSSGSIAESRRIWIAGNSVTSAVWNDYAEYRECDQLSPGCVVQENDNGKLTITNKRLVPGASIISDTWGFAQGETTKARTPIAVSGRVLAYTFQPREEYHAGMAVCSGPNGTVDIMTREEIRDYPDAIIGIVSEIPNYEEWGGGPTADRSSVKVNGRIWIKIK